MITNDSFLRLLRNGNTSYKYFFLLGCIDSLVSSKRKYDFKYLGQYMISEAILHGDFTNKRYTANDRLFDVVIYLYSKDEMFSALNDIESIYDRISDNMDSYVKKMIHQLTLYVPYRLLVIDDISEKLTGLKDCEKNRMIEKLSHVYDTIYEIDDKAIIWKDSTFDFIIHNKESIKKEIIKALKNKFDRK